jgi:hypothetical protein
MKTLASINTIFLLLTLWPHSTHLNKPHIMFVDEGPMLWTPILAIMRAASLLCVAGQWVLAFRSKRQS